MARSPIKWQTTTSGLGTTQVLRAEAAEDVRAILGIIAIEKGLRIHGELLIRHKAGLDQPVRHQISQPGGVAFYRRAISATVPRGVIEMRPPNCAMNPDGGLELVLANAACRLVKRRSPDNISDQLQSQLDTLRKRQSGIIAKSV